MLNSICQQIWETEQWPQDWKRSVCIPIPKKDNAKECSNYHTIALISHASNVVLKILQARLQQYMNWELPDVQAGFRKGRGTRDQIANIRWIIEKAREFKKKTSTYVSLTTLKPLTVWITTNCGKFFKRLEYQTTLLVSWETFMSVKKQYYNVRGKNLTFSWAPKSLRTVTTAMKLKHLLLGRKAIANLDWVL